MTLSIDVGGTFTDFVIIDEDISHFKIPSTPSNPENAIKLGVKGKKFEGNFFHGTTVATNAFLEGKGSETALITNEGFEDILFIGRQNRPELYKFNIERPKPPIKPDNCFGVKGRVNHKGEIIEKLDEEEIYDIAESLKKNKLSTAVCLLHSYANPKHELKIGEILDEYDLSYSLSSQVSREFREYERGITTLLDAYLAPLIRDYFSSVTDILGKEPLIMKSGGGLERASQVDSVDTLLSGPAGGVAGGFHISKISDITNIVTFDMGGTSADMAAIIGGEIYWKDQGSIDSFPIQSKMIDIVTVGSGGGSIARCDEGGALRVGPESSGAYPGPICYGRGGEKPTITDALLLMGYIDPDYFLGGEMKLEEEKTKAEMKKLSNELGLGYEETLLGIFKVANSKMARVMKKITVERGLNPKEFSILAFGGAGPLHAAYLAKELNISHVMIPPMPGVFSALGMVTGDIVRDYSRTLITSLSDKEKLDDVINEMSEEAAEGEKRVLLGLRYKGQSYHINIPYEENVEEKFHQEHERNYGYSNKDEEIEVVRIHLEVRKNREVEKIPTRFGEKEEVSSRECLFPEGKKVAKVFYRNGLEVDQSTVGPAIIEDTNSTLLVPPSWTFKVDNNGIVHMEEIQ